MKIKFIALVFAWYFTTTSWHGEVSTIGPFGSEEQCNWGSANTGGFRHSACWYVGPISEKR